MTWRDRFGMHAPPLPRGAAGESFFTADPHYQRLAQAFDWLASEPGIGVLTGEPGVGKTSAIRHLCRALPASEHRVVYLCDCAVKPLDLYRMLAAELGLRPGPRAQIVADIKRALVSLVDEHGVVPIVILDDAQGLRDDLLHELHGLCSHPQWHPVARTKNHKTDSTHLRGVNETRGAGGRRARGSGSRGRRGRGCRT